MYFAHETAGHQTEKAIACDEHLAYLEDAYRAGEPSRVAAVVDYVREHAGCTSEDVATNVFDDNSFRAFSAILAARKAGRIALDGHTDQLYAIPEEV